MPARDPQVRHHSSRLAVLERHRGPDDPETVDARRDLAAAKLEQHVRQVVDGFPPLTSAQRSRLAALLRPTVGGDRDAA